MNIELKYGKRSIVFKLPAGAVIPEFGEPEYSVTKEGFAADMLRYLPTDRASYSNIAIVVSDKTRLCSYPEYLPWLTEILMQKGAGKENITFYIAYGTHPRQTEEESNEAYGDIYKEYSFIHHNCKDTAVFTYLAITRRGTPVDLRKDILASTLLITFGSISHHYFAAYGGGRKLIFPGLGSRRAIYHNHGLFLDRERRTLAAACQPANLESNPLADDLKEIDTYMPPKISVHGIMNASGKVCQLLVGSSYDDFLEACRVHDNYYRYASPVLYDLVVASSGGYPKDINFIQAHKSVHHAAAFVKDGGKLVMLSECIDKIASDYFMEYLRAGSFEAAFTMLEKNYEGNGGTALSMMLKTKRVHILMLTSLDEETCRILGVSRITMEEIQRIIDTEKGTMAVIRNASMLVK